MDRARMEKIVCFFEKITNMLAEAEAKLIVLLCHHNADPDALCSAYTFSKLLKKFDSKLTVEISAAQGISKLSKHILEKIPVQLVASPHIEEADVIFLLDTNTVQQLGEWKTRLETSRKPLVMIDHHAPHPKTESLASLCVIDETASSTCEIVYRIFKEAGVKPSEDEARAMFLGMACDTKHFSLANSETFKAASELVDSGVDAKEELAFLSVPMSRSERIARLKAASRVRFLKFGEWMAAFSDVTSYQASAARALLGLGADVAVVGGERNGALKISLRSSHNFNKKTGVHLGRDIAQPLGESLHGMGGGHPAAAGVNGEGKLEEAFETCAELLRKSISH
ncbi:MAG: DHH family phosphoesterase [Candidatus Bathyarchaeota archaeon]|nr:DHH family phosphoesterase [Candidatus Bathyarchaeota archaeon]